VTGNQIEEQIQSLCGLRMHRSRISFFGISEAGKYPNFPSIVMKCIPGALR
jgi:hypothetical protein